MLMIILKKGIPDHPNKKNSIWYERKQERWKERFAYMPSNAFKELKDALDLGLGIVTRIWDHSAKDWVTGVFVMDIDDDGEAEVIACSRDGRVHLLSKDGERRWERVIGEKAWVGTGVASGLLANRAEATARIIVGTRDGKVFVLNKYGQTMTKDGQLLSFDADGKALDQEQEQQACWYDVGYAIRQISVNRQQPSEILIGSEDRCAYGLDYTTGTFLWKYQTNGWVRTVSLSDVNGDGQDEVLVGSVDRYLYLLDQQANVLIKHPINHPVRTVYAADIDKDGHVEVLVTTDGKDLVALNYIEDTDNSTGYFQEKWRRYFGGRLLSLCVTDIDKDGQLEIIAGSEDKHIYFLDDRGNMIWRHNHKYRALSICSWDIDNDDLPELLVGTDHNRVRALRIRLRRGIDKKIRRAYRLLGEPDSAEIAGLTADQRALLQDVLGMNTREFVTFKQVQEQLEAKAYDKALSLLVQLEQQNVERLWQKDIAYIRTICLRHIIGEPSQEIVVGTSTGDIYDFTAHGRRIWLTSLHDHIVDLQTGFIDRRRQEEIVICSSDHHVYIVSGSQKHKQRNAYIDDTWVSSICVTAPNRRGVAEIIIGSEAKKLYIYQKDLLAPIETLPTDEGVRIVRAHMPPEEHMPEIITASLGNRVYAYTRRGERLWCYETRDHIQAVCLKDINNDGKIEVLIGSEDRNVHVVDNTGHLLWRYYLPHSALTVDATENDSKIFVGCANGYLYVFSNEGDLLWTYQAKDRIHAIRVEDINDDGQTEIIIGAEDQLEVLRIVNQRQVSELITQCWTALCQQQPTEQVIEILLKGADPFLQAFALNKLAERGNRVPSDFDILEKLAKEGAVEARKALVHTIMALYLVDPLRAQALLFQLSTDSEQEVRNALIEHILTLINHNWELGFHYLKRAADNPDRFVRRMAIRKLHQLIDVPGERSLNTRKEIFKLLLAATKDKESEWIQQEAARTLAHLLNQHYGKLIISIHLFIVKGLRRSIWEHITHAITNFTVKNYLNAVIHVLFELDEDNAPERIQRVVNALQATEELIYGKDIHSIYAELYHLFTIQTIAGIANYRSTLNPGQFNTNNQFAPIILDVFSKLSIVSRPLKMYLWREGFQDRQASLLETLEAIEQVHKYIEQQYLRTLLGEPITRLPDHQIFLLLLAKWRKLVQGQLSDLRGRAELKGELQTKDVRNEEQVGIWLTVKNTGRGLASAVKITLLQEGDNPHFHVIGSNVFETEAILPQEETTAEFILEPHCAELNLKFDIEYDDVDNTPRLEHFEECLKLREYYQDFHYIPNPYSTGTPTQDNKMFYGREKDMAFLKDNLTRDARSVIVLYGQRRSGKTTVLLQLINSPVLDEHIPVLIDMQRISYLISIDTFLHRLAYYIVQAMRRKQILFVSPPELNSFKAEPTHTFDVFLDQVEEQLAGRKLILLIDEFEVLEDQVTKGKLEPEIFDYLRDIVQHRQKINFLFSGTHKITEYTRRYRSIFFNIAIHRRLSKISSEGAEALIQKPVEGYLEYEALTVKKIHQLTADQPYLIHLMCRAIVDYCNERGKTFVTINDVNIVLREVMQTGQFHLGWLWDQIAPEERLALVAIAEGGKEEGRWLSFNEIEEIYHHYDIPYKREYILDSLKTLIEADIIENKAGDSRKNTLDSNKFRISVGLTRSWLLKEHPLDLVRKELND